MRNSGWLLLTASLGVLALTAGGLRAQGGGERGFPYGDLKELRLQGKLVDLKDELARKYGAKVLGGGAEKQWGLALPEGELFTFLDNAAYRRLLSAEAKGELPNGAVEIQARQFPRSTLVEVVSFRPIPAEGLQRRFHCAVCNVSTQDWGPCICCGQEMKVVRPAP